MFGKKRRELMRQFGLQMEQSNIELARAIAEDGLTGTCEDCRS